MGRVQCRGLGHCISCNVQTDYSASGSAHGPAVQHHEEGRRQVLDPISESDSRPAYIIERACRKRRSR